MKHRAPAILLLGSALVAAACGVSAGTTMNMGDASLPRADSIAGASVLEGDFELLDTVPAGYGAVAGSAWIARYDGGTTVTIEFSGLLPLSAYIAHVHGGLCADGGGPHYKFDPEGLAQPPNEIHLRFTSDNNGNGLMTAINEQVAGNDARSIVVHPIDNMEGMIACAQFG